MKPHMTIILDDLGIIITLTVLMKGRLDVIYEYFIVWVFSGLWVYMSGRWIYLGFYGIKTNSHIQFALGIKSHTRFF